jgi:hypothetical protein
VQIAFALIADAANQSTTNKLNLLGVFEEISAAGFPLLFASGVFAVRLNVTRHEAGVERPLMIVMMNQDGKALWKAEGTFMVKVNGDGISGHVDFIIPFSPPLLIPEAGDYSFDVLVSGTSLYGNKGEMPRLQVRQI